VTRSVGTAERRAGPGEPGFDYDRLPPGYYDHVYHAGTGVRSKWHHMKFQRFAAALQGLHRHLDIGCGPGTFIGSLPEGAHASLGIDIAKPQIAYADAHYGGPGRSFRAIPASSLPFEPASFDAVTLIELIEHLPRPTNVKLLRDALGVLKPGGKIFVSTPNYHSAWPLIERLVSRVGGVNYGAQHITRYHRASLRALLEDAGATDVRVEGYMLAAPFAAGLSWRLADILARLEPRFLTDRLGLLLFASGTKRNGY